MKIYGLYAYRILEIYNLYYIFIFIKYEDKFLFDSNLLSFLWSGGNLVPDDNMMRFWLQIQALSTIILSMASSFPVCYIQLFHMFACKISPGRIIH